MSREYKMSDGQVTTNARRYVRSWTAIAKPLEKHMNATLLGFDPAFSFQSKETGFLIRLDVCTAQNILAAIKKARGEAKP